MGVWIAVIVVIAAVLLLVVRFTAIGIRMKKSALGRVMALLREVRYNVNTGKRYGYKGGLKLFRTGVWEIHKHEMDFLPEETRAGLNDLYERIYHINEQVQTSVEGKGESYLMSVNVDSLMIPLQTSAAQLEQWIKANSDNPEYAPKPANFFGF